LVCGNDFDSLCLTSFIFSNNKHTHRWGERRGERERQREEERETERGRERKTETETELETEICSPEPLCLHFWVTVLVKMMWSCLNTAVVS
jgi:hypothetical protein